MGEKNGSKTPNVDRLLEQERESLSALPSYLQPAWIKQQRPTQADTGRQGVSNTKAKVKRRAS